MPAPRRTTPERRTGMPWFAILNKDRSPRPAWKAFKSWREGDGAQAGRRTRPETSNVQQPLPAPPALAAPSPGPDLPDTGAQAAAVGAVAEATPTPTPEPIVAATP